jgi:hypothetical protein
MGRILNLLRHLFCGGASQVTDLTRFLRSLNRCPGATNVAIASGERQLSVKLPMEYVEFLKFSNGGEGFVGKEYVILWGIQDLASMNQSYKVQEYVQGLLIFGSNGGGEAFGFDTRTPEWPIVEVPFVGMEWGLAKPIGASFYEFLESLRGTGSLKESIRQEMMSGVDAQGNEIFEIKPIILGGSPTDLANKKVLNREVHIKAVAFYNKIIKEVRDRPKGSCL